MKKKILGILTIVLLICVLASCVSKTNIKLEGDSADNMSISNQGLVVEHGDYLYFINGYKEASSIKNAKDNVYGSVKLGAIYRAKKDDITNKDLVVPTIVYSNAKGSGVTILGNWIYYTTPNTDKNKQTKQLQTSFLNYQRTSLDGSVVQRITTVKGKDVPHKFTEEGLYYFKESKLNFVHYNEKKIGKSEVLFEDLSGAILPMTNNTNTKTLLNEAVIQKRFDKEEPASNLYIVNSKKEMKAIFEDNQSVSYQLKEYLYKDGSIILFYVKNSVTASGEKFEGLYSIESDKEGNFNKKDAKLIIDTKVDHFTPISDGSIVYTKSKFLKRAYDNEVKNVIDIAFTAEITLLKYDSEKIIYAENGLIYQSKISSHEVAKQITKTKALLSWYKPEILGEYIYFIGDSDKYLYRAKLDGSREELVGEKIVTNKEKK